MIIGLTGKKQHGKDTVGKILVEHWRYRRLAFADALKESAAALFDLDPAVWDEWKNEPEARVIVSVREAEAAELTVRQFLQRYGTEAHRDIFGEGVWTDVIDRAIEEYLFVGRPSRPKVVVTDVRFDNEAEVIRKHRGIVVEVFRPDMDDGGADTHASEDLPRADMLLYNGEGIEELRLKIAQCEAEGWAATLL